MAKQTRRQKEWYLRNRERVLAEERARRVQEPGQKPHQKEWYLRNRARLLEKAHERRAQDPEYMKRWREANADHLKAYDQRKTVEDREYHRAYHLKKTYGLTPSAYEAMAQAQDNRCAICRQEPSKRLRVDHDHETGAIRALLCDRCNTGLGQFQDNPRFLDAAKAYLHKHGIS